MTATEAASGLETVVGGVAGRGNGSIALGCTTFIAVPGLSVHAFTGSGVPLVSISTCGHTTQAATAAPLIQTSKLGPIDIAPSANGSQFTGTYDACGRYGALEAAARGSMSVVPDQASPAPHHMALAARFADSLTATSAGIAAGSSGTVR